METLKTAALNDPRRLLKISGCDPPNGNRKSRKKTEKPNTAKKMPVLRGHRTLCLAVPMRICHMSKLHE